MTRRPLIVLLTGIIGLGVVALPTLDLRLGVPTDGDLAAETTQRQAHDLLAEGFVPGFNGPLAVVIDATDADDAKVAFAETAAAVGELDGVAAVAPPMMCADAQF